MKKHPFILCVALVAASVVLLAGSVATATVLPASEDTFIRNDYGGGSVDDNFSTAAVGNIIKNPEHVNSYLVKFDTSGQGPLVTSAVLNLHEITQYEGTSWTLKAYRITSDWVASQATTNSAKTGVPWTTQGGDFTLTDAGSAAITATTRYDTWCAIDITAIAQYWQNNPGQNYGVLVTLIDQNPSYPYSIFESKESAGGQPFLDIVTTPEPATMSLLVLGGLGALARRRK